MTAKDIYNIKKYTIKDIDMLMATFNEKERLFPEMSKYEYYDVLNIKDIKGGLEIRCIQDYCFDRRRTWELYTLWKDKKPFMIIQLAGREGDDVVNRYITNKELYIETVEYLESLIEKKDDIETIEEDIETIEEDIEMPLLTNFYGRELEDFYDEFYVPKYKIGDKVKAKVKEDLDIYSPKEVKIEIEVEIVEVMQGRTYSYRVKDLTRKLSHKRYNYDEKTIVIEEKYIKELYPDRYFQDIFYILDESLECIEW